MKKHRFHLLGLPHTSTNRDYSACAYTQKVLKFVSMMAPRGHEIIHYGNEESLRPDSPKEPVGKLCEHVQIFSEAERQSYFGPHDRQKLYTLSWESNAPYWEQFNERCIREIKPRIRKGDFILAITSSQSSPLSAAFPGSAKGDTLFYDSMTVEYGVGYYGTFSRYCCFESHGHREWIHGMQRHGAHWNGGTWENNCDAVIPNYFDLDDFVCSSKPESIVKLHETLKGEPYYLFCGRVIDSKGIAIAVEATAALGAKLVVAGQGGPTTGSDRIIPFGCAGIEERAWLMKHAVATFAPTMYREPFGGVAVEAQICGTPCITTDHGAFVETVGREWRCASHREFVEAARRAKTVTTEGRRRIQHNAAARYSLEAVAPLYERYFDRLYSFWAGGWYEMRDIETIDINAPRATE